MIITEDMTTGEVTVLHEDAPNFAGDLREAVNAERDRRLGLPFPYMGHWFDRDPVSLQRITGAATMAGFALAGLMPATPVTWITADNTPMTLTPAEMLGLGAAAAERERAIVFAARAIKDLPEIPADFAADHRWP